MRFELPIIDKEGPMDQPRSIHRNLDGSIDFDFYRRRASRERRFAQRLWVRHNLAILSRMLNYVAVSIMRTAFRRALPLRTCCLTAARRECCV